MKKINYMISEKYTNILSRAINSKVQVIYSDRFIKEFGSTGLEASYFILKLNEAEFLKISTEWFECDETLECFYNFIIESISYSVKTNSSIYSFGCQNFIKSISLVSRYLNIDGKSICHTFGIIIERNDLKRIMIKGGESAFQNVVLIDDNEHISKELENSDNVVFLNLSDGRL